MTKSLEITMYIEELKSKIKLLENLRYPGIEEDQKSLSEEILKSAENLKNVFYKNSEEENSDIITGKKEIPVYTILGITRTKEELIVLGGEKVMVLKCGHLKKYLTASPEWL